MIIGEQHTLISILVIILLLLFIAIIMISIIIFAFINLKKQRALHVVEIDKFNDYKVKEQEYITSSKQKLNEN